MSIADSLKLARHEDRLYELEKHSHAPVSFLTCNRCYASVIEENWDNHLEWHEKD